MRKNIIFIILIVLGASLSYGQNNKVKKTVGIAPAKSISVKKTKEREGPANIPFYVEREIEHDYGFKQDVLRSFDEIYRDANINSGYYYYIPGAYSLQFIEHTGAYEINVNHNAITDTEGGRATVTAILRPQLTRNEIAITKELLRQNIKGKPEEAHGITDLIPLPLRRQPEILFDNLSQFGIEESDISIRAPSDLDSPIYISFTTSNIADLMTMFFNNTGLYGNVVLYPDGDDMKESITIPFGLKINHPDTYGVFELPTRTWRNNTWQNKTDYPVNLTAFHVLKKENQKFKIYTWTINGVEIPEGGKAKFDALQVPDWIDTNNEIKKIWLEYTVNPCRTCDKVVRDKIMEGTIPVMVTRNIIFEILTPLEYTQAEFIGIKTRSYQANPNGLTKEETRLRVDEDRQTLKTKLYMSEGAKPNFEYQIQVVMPEGEKYTSNWIKSRELEVVIGKRQIKEYIPNFEE